MVPMARKVADISTDARASSDTPEAVAAEAVAGPTNPTSRPTEPCEEPRFLTNRYTLLRTMPGRE
jgi:hypothetical protein